MNTSMKATPEREASGLGLDALRDAAEAGPFRQVWCLTPDRLARSRAYQMLITDELGRHGVEVQYVQPWR